VLKVISSCDVSIDALQFLDAQSFAHRGSLSTTTGPAT
jgi:hypothetical protein